VASTSGPEESGSPTLLTGWGRTAPSRAAVHRPGGAAELVALLANGHPRGVLARGLGRCYGDAAQNAGGQVVATDGMSYLREFDSETGRVTVGAGMALEALLDVVVPRGWFLSVTPGTRRVTVGGAIAADVHGKNHHRDGSFARHVRSFVLLTPSGERLTLTAEDSPAAFWATAGGMGLTGVILEATLKLLPVETARVRVHRRRAGDLDQLMQLMEAGDRRHRYSVAWIDCLARGSALGRSVLVCGDHARRDELPVTAQADPLARSPSAYLRAPPWAPPGLLNRLSIRAFNELYFRRAPRDEERRLESLDSFFYPLDAIPDWNRLYGSRGLLQYQFVVPFGHEDAVRAVLERLGKARCPSFLAVIKRMGPETGPLSFPMPGWTLAVDMPAGSGALGPLLDGLDELVAGAGGRIYLAKDSRLRPELLKGMYPRLEEWRRAREELDPNGRMRSDLARRLSLA
jgi:decaprenylphospho-beta-D-ribofuranose 2-oxidase